MKQPYATLIAERIKEYEFRTWKINYCGEFLIHAGKGKNLEYVKKFEYLDYPLSCIIAKVLIEDSIEVTDEFREILKKKVLYPILI